MPGDGGCSDAATSVRGMICYDNGAVTTCCPKPVVALASPKCPAGSRTMGCLENGEPDTDCCAQPGTGGCEGGAASSPGGSCFSNGAVYTCCKEDVFAEVTDATHADVAGTKEAVAIGAAVSDATRGDDAGAKEAAARGAEVTDATRTDDAGENVAAAIGKEVGVGKLCPSGLQPLGCLEQGNSDADCCAAPGHGGCENGAEASAGRVCSLSGAVVTCCPRHAPKSSERTTTIRTTTTFLPPRTVPPTTWPASTSAQLTTLRSFTYGSFATVAPRYASSTAGARAVTTWPRVEVTSLVRPVAPIPPEEETIAEPSTEPPTTTTPRLQLPDEEGSSGTFFCWAVSMTHGGEADLTRNHFYSHNSIFACEDWSVYADGNLDPVPVTQLGSFWSKWAKWGSYLNTAVFLRAWDALFKEGKWKRRGWTVKVDPDSVWFVQRLRWHLKGMRSSEKFILRNGGPQMLGPIEVFSVTAVRDMSERMKEVCMYAIDVSGEDGWIDSCVGNLGITKKYDDQLLSSTGGEVGKCGNHWVVAFHPYKNVGSFNACVGTSTR